MFLEQFNFEKGKNNGVVSLRGNGASLRQQGTERQAQTSL